MEYNTRVPEVENILSKIGQSLYSGGVIGENHKTEMTQVNFQIQQSINVLVSISNQEEFHQIKLAFASRILRDRNIQKVSIHVNVPSTVFGELNEQHVWNFAIEHAATDNCKLEAYADNLMQIWLDKQDHTNQDKNSDDVRFTNLIHNPDLIDTIFNSVKEQLGNEKDLSQATLLTALILFDLEFISHKRQHDLLIYQDLYNKDNVLDKWLACLDIHSVYQKPMTSFNTYSIH